MLERSAVYLITKRRTFAAQVAKCQRSSPAFSGARLCTLAPLEIGVYRLACSAFTLNIDDQTWMMRQLQVICWRSRAKS